MLKPIFQRIFLCASLIIPTICFSATQPANSTDQSTQKQATASAFPIYDGRTEARIGVDFGDLLSRQQPDIAVAMKKITVVACAAGDCQFAKANSGLGFYEATFKLPEADVKAKQFELLVVACRASGCTKAKLTTPIVYPRDK